MRKSFFSIIYVTTLLTAGLTIHQAFAQRTPAVEPITEISIEENRPTGDQAKPESGFDFNHKNALNQVPASRVPANITSKPTNAPYSYIGPMIFLLALPFALWIIISKKMSNEVVSDKKVDYYSKTFQFRPYKTDYQEQDVDDDQDYPKAS
ncbi:MAG: hypothetical protein WC635_13600 [Bacteriovorax sp.]|jgi:hypothetical protein